MKTWPGTLREVEIQDASEAYSKVLAWFFSYPERETGLSELADAVVISKATANRVVTSLSQEGFLRIEPAGRLWRISCNPEHRYNYTKKVAYNLSMVYESGILEVLHSRIPNPRAVILFGSYRKGDDNEKSDIDIAVEVLDGKSMRVERLGVLPRLGYRKDVAVNAHVFSRGAVDANLFANIANGILLEGFLEVKP